MAAPVKQKQNIQFSCFITIIITVIIMTISCNNHDCTTDQKCVSKCRDKKESERNWCLTYSNANDNEYNQCMANVEERYSDCYDSCPCLDDDIL